MYREEGGEIFPGVAKQVWSRIVRTFSEGLSAPKYSDDGLEKVLHRKFGETTWAQLPAKPVLLITSYNTLTREGVVFKSWDATGRQKQWADVKLWQIVKASCSAPTYFPATLVTSNGVEMPLIDGGVVANNPTACAIAEGVRFNDHDANPDPCKIEEFHVVSLGTGQLTRPITRSEAQKWGPLEWPSRLSTCCLTGLPMRPTTSPATSCPTRSTSAFRLRCTRPMTIWTTPRQRTSTRW
jgi:patatin-like phospholipase/acyl hydrolase